MEHPMHRFALVALVGAIALAAFAPSPLRAQYRGAQTVGAPAHARIHEAAWSTRASTVGASLTTTRPDSASGRRSLARHLLVGAGAGAAAGLAVGIYSRNHSSDCNDCITPASAIPAFGAFVGAVAGTLMGWLVYVSRSDEPHRSSAPR
jgi:hypothetical protein